MHLSQQLPFFHGRSNAPVGGIDHNIPLEVFRLDVIVQHHGHCVGGDRHHVVGIPSQVDGDLRYILSGLHDGSP